MPTSLAIDDHLTAVRAAGERLLTYALDAGFDAPVPTCPDWVVRDLVAHQATVHRWAAAHVRGDDPDGVPDEAATATVADLAGYYAEGHEALLAALVGASPDLVAMTFLKDAPPPRRFWARRQAHETTIHMVDALAASLGRVPTAAETGIDPSLAADGIDELLGGFFTRGASKLFDGTEYTIGVVPGDVDRRWLVMVAAKLTVEPDVREGADATLSGTAAELYLALWNRGDQARATGRPGVLERWRATQRVGWS